MMLTCKHLPRPLKIKFLGSSGKYFALPGVFGVVWASLWTPQMPLRMGGPGVRGRPRDILLHQNVIFPSQRPFHLIMLLFGEPNRWFSIVFRSTFRHPHLHFDWFCIDFGSVWGGSHGQARVWSWPDRTSSGPTRPAKANLAQP